MECGEVTYAMAKALINYRILEWASDRAGVDADGLGAKLNTSVDRIASWLSGAEKPTFRQAQKLAAALNIPFGFLFLNNPPVDEVSIPDLRTVGSDPTQKLDLNFRDLLKDVMFKRDWYRDFMIEVDGKPRPFVGRFALSDDAKVIARDMRRTLLPPDGDMPHAANSEALLSELMKAAEAAGVWVMRNGVVGNNTRRPLSVRQFRGFAISDPHVPLIFINGKDAKAAQLFTLAHELTHIWLGESGVSNVQIGERDFGAKRTVEQKCNEVAAEFLVPEASIRGSWRTDYTFSNNLDNNVLLYRVSRIVIARRAFDLGLCKEDEYRRLYAFEQAQWDRDAAEDGGGGGNFYLNLPIRNGSRFTNSVVSQAISGQLLLRQAALLLNTQPASLVKFHQKRLAA